MCGQPHIACRPCKLAEVRAAEAALEAKVKAGLEVPDFVQAILQSDRVTEY